LRVYYQLNEVRSSCFTQGWALNGVHCRSAGFWAKKLAMELIGIAYLMKPRVDSLIILADFYQQGSKGR